MGIYYKTSQCLSQNSLQFSSTNKMASARKPDNSAKQIAFAYHIQLLIKSYQFIFCSILNLFFPGPLLSLNSRQLLCHVWVFTMGSGISFL